LSCNYHCPNIPRLGLNKLAPKSAIKPTIRLPNQPVYSSFGTLHEEPSDDGPT
jgi:hypothetical protein